MKVLVTGAKGFIGRNLCAALKNIRDGKDKTHPHLSVDDIFTFDVDDDAALLDTYCAKADFVFNLAGINRPQRNEAFMEGNCDFADALLQTLKRHGNTCPVMMSSSTQALLDNDYGKSKKAGEDLLFAYGRETSAKVLVYRFPNVFGKWCRPNYNSAVATFCHNIANDLDITVNNRDTVLTLVYIDDLVAEMMAALEGHETKAGDFCEVPIIHQATLGEIVDLLYAFAAQPQTLLIPEMPANSFAKKLYATYLSYLPARKVKFPLDMHVDARGSFTELLRTAGCGQFSVNVSKPGITKGEHWHHTKWEFFMVVSGHGCIRMRKIGTDEVLEFEVSGDKVEAVHMLPGYTHSLVNLSDSADLVTVMWANELFDPQKPDTFFEKV